MEFIRELQHETEMETPLFRPVCSRGMLARGFPAQVSAGIRARFDCIGVVLGITGTFFDIARSLENKNSRAKEMGGTVEELVRGESLVSLL
jgi:hypothetical protein